MEKELITAKENLILALQHKESKWIPYAPKDVANVSPRAFLDRHFGSVDNPHGFDDFGAEYTFSPDINAPMPMEKNLVLTDIENWREQVHFPELDSIDWSAKAAQDLQGVDRENKFVLVWLVRNQFERLQTLMGFENTLVALLTDTEYVDEFLEAYSQWRLRVVDYIIEYYKPDGILFNDDYASAKGMFMSPAYWREHFKPHLKKLVDRCHEKGVYAMMHCCGKMKDIFPDYVEIGTDAIQCQALNDLPEMKKKYGDRITILGGIDNINVLDRPGATEEEMVAEVQRTMREVAAGGSYVMMQGFFTPLANEVAGRVIEEINQPLREKYQK